MTGPRQDSEDEIIATLTSADGEERAWAAQLLATHNSERSSAALYEALLDADERVQDTAAQSLALRGDVAAMSRILAIVESDNGATLRATTWAAWELAGRTGSDDQLRVRAALESLKARAAPVVVDQIGLLLPEGT